MTVRLGPIFYRELSRVARRATSYRQRATLAIALTLVAAANIWLYGILTGWQLSLRQLAQLSDSLYLAAVTTQLMLSIWIVPGLVAPAIAEERERGTLSAVLASRLSNAEIVAGKAASGLLQYAVCLATTLPIMILLPLMGAVEPMMVLLAYACTASTAFLVAALSLAVSISERRVSRAVGKTIALVTIWCLIPPVIQSRPPFLLPRYWPSWLYPLNSWILASSPVSVVQALYGFGSTLSLLERMSWMMALELAAGSLLLLWSVLWLRRASRGLEDTAGAVKGPGGLARLFGRIRPRRAACGDDPVLWRELHTWQRLGITEVCCILIGLGLFGLLAYGTYTMAVPAFSELRAGAAARSETSTGASSTRS